MAFVLAWALREPNYVWSFKKHLKKLGSPTSQGVFNALRPVLKVPAPPAKERFTPQLSKLRPAWIISTWTVSVLTEHVVPAIQEYLMPAKGSPTASGLARLSTILRRKKLRFLATNYTTEHLIRTALLATKTTEPGVEFVKMGSSCQNVHFNKLNGPPQCGGHHGPAPTRSGKAHTKTALLLHLHGWAHPHEEAEA